MLDAESGEQVARRLAAIIKPDLDGMIARLGEVLARCEEIKARLPLIEQHCQACAAARAQEKGALQ